MASTNVSSARLASGVNNIDALPHPTLDNDANHKSPAMSVHIMLTKTRITYGLHIVQVGALSATQQLCCSPHYKQNYLRLRLHGVPFPQVKIGKMAEHGYGVRLRSS